MFIVIISFFHSLAGAIPSIECKDLVNTSATEYGTECVNIKKFGKSIDLRTPKKCDIDDSRLECFSKVVKDIPKFSHRGEEQVLNLITDLAAKDTLSDSCEPNPCTMLMHQAKLDLVSTGLVSKLNIKKVLHSTYKYLQDLHKDLPRRKKVYQNLLNKYSKLLSHNT